MLFSGVDVSPSSARLSCCIREAVFPFPPQRSGPQFQSLSELNKQALTSRQSAKHGTDLGVLERACCQFSLRSAPPKPTKPVTHVGSQRRAHAWGMCSRPLLFVSIILL